MPLFNLSQTSAISPTQLFDGLDNSNGTGCLDSPIKYTVQIYATNPYSGNPELSTTTPESVNTQVFDISALAPGVKFGYFNFTFTIAGACPIDVDVVMEVVFQIIEN